MNRNPRNASLLAQVSPTNPFRETVARGAFAIGLEFEKAVEVVGADGRLSLQGKQEKARAIVEKARGDLLALQKPIDDHRAESVRMRAAMKKPVYDKTDIVAALARREFRERAASMSLGQKAALMSGPRRSVEFIDSLLEMPAWVSGINLDDPNEAALYEAAKQSRQRDLNPELEAALEARAGTEAEIAMCLDIVRSDIESDAAQLASRAA